MTRTALGDLEHQVLLATLRLKDQAYSVSVVLEIEERTSREVAQAWATPDDGANPPDDTW